MNTSSTALSVGFRLILSYCKFVRNMRIIEYWGGDSAP